MFHFKTAASPAPVHRMVQVSRCAAGGGGFLLKHPRQEKLFTLNGSQLLLLRNNSDG